MPYTTKDQINAAVTNHHTLVDHTTDLRQAILRMHRPVVGTLSGRGWHSFYVHCAECDADCGDDCQSNGWPCATYGLARDWPA